MNKIYLITTEGCLGCEIMEKNILKVISKYKDWCLGVYDFKIMPKELLNLDITDFPATVFIKNNNIHSYYIGSLTKDRIDYIINN